MSYHSELAALQEQAVNDAYEATTKPQLHLIIATLIHDVVNVVVP